MAVTEGFGKPVEDRVREALRHADKQGKLGVVAAVSTIEEDRLRGFMEGTKKMDLADIISLGVFLS